MPGLQFVADIMNHREQHALTRALEKFLHSKWKDKIWPASKHTELKDVDLVVLPLQRVGAPVGRSDASVFVAYYRARANGTSGLPASLPLVVKIDEKDKMRDELSSVQRWPPLSAATDDFLAKPIDCLDCGPANAILVAPFRSVYEPSAPEEVKVNDLWGLLEDADWLRDSARDEAWRRVSRHVGHALDVVGGLHRETAGERQTQSYADALDWYMRNTRDPAGRKESRAHIPRGIFGDGPTVTAFDRRWVNPTCVIDRLRQPARTFETTTGAIHGDLHPRNIVLDKMDQPHIIDFGWARTDAPVVLDYILLDINLRSITLPSQVHESEVFRIAGFLQGDHKPTGLRPAVRARMDLIHKHIWGRVKRRGIVEDWTSEYVIPFFMMAYGLLVHLDSARNQMALVATVLAAAEHIEDQARRE